MQKLTIPGKLPGYNQLTTGHWAKRQRIKNEAMDAVGWLIKQQKIRPIQGKADIRIICYEPNMMRDKSNVRAGAEKIILDALQNNGIIRNDNWKWLEDRPAVVLLDRENPRVEVEILEATI